MVELNPGTPEHARVLKYVKDRLERSERAMSDFYARWRVNERKLQAYVTLSEHEKILDAMNKRGKPPKIVSLVMPYAHAVVQTTVTYLIHTFCGRQPIFQVSSYDGGKAENARKLEKLLQYNADHTKLILQIYNMLMNAEVYQFGVLKVSWQNEKRARTRMQPVQTYDLGGFVSGTTMIPSRIEELVYSGNVVESIDPFLFFPDPSVPMTEVSRYGEFVFWRSYKSRIWGKMQEAQGVLRNIDAVTATMPHNFSETDSDRAARHMGAAIAGGRVDTEQDNTLHMIQFDEGTVDLIPKQLGLGESTTPERWMFTLGNKEVILRAEPLEADHGFHPVAVIEPNALGQSFGSISTVDVVGPVQDHISWLVNSHMQNVRGAINNRLIVNPHYIEMSDLRKDPSSPDDDNAFIVRMKQSAWGQDPKNGIFQLQVADVTQSNLKNIDLMIRMGHMFAGINDNLMGLQDGSGRKTATEVRVSGEAGASRLAAKARLCSAQGLSDLPQMMGINLQQRLDVGFYQRVLGNSDPAMVIANAESIAGDFAYPINDGTLPLDRAMLLNVWKEILMAVAQDPELRQNYSLPKIFSYVADLGGASNIDTFKVQMMGQGQIDQGLAAGNLVPTSALAGAAGV
jgi:hypothetical protein